MNADMSYLPVYPGMSGEAFLSGVSSDKYTRVELLGTANDIDRLIANINLSVDPYFDYSKISSDYVFGRVYEDFMASADRTLRMYRNPSLNMNQSEIEVQDSSFIWTIDISATGYSEKELAGLQFIVYNMETLGKNPYMAAELTALTDGLWHEVDLYQTWSDAENIEQTLSGLNGIDGREYVRVAGTLSPDCPMTRQSCNYIDNIKMISVRYDGMVFQLRFDIDDPTMLDSTFVKENTINVVLYNTRDMQLFNYYHYMDVYGAVNVRHVEPLRIPNDILRDDVSLIYDKAHYQKPTVLDDIKSYYKQANLNIYTD